VRPDEEQPPEGGEGFAETLRAMTEDAVEATMYWEPVCTECDARGPQFATMDEAVVWAGAHRVETGHALSLACAFQTVGGGAASFTERIPDRLLDVPNEGDERGRQSRRKQGKNELV